MLSRNIHCPMCKGKRSLAITSMHKYARCNMCNYTVPKRVVLDGKHVLTKQDLKDTYLEVYKTSNIIEVIEAPLRTHIEESLGVDADFAVFSSRHYSFLADYEDLLQYLRACPYGWIKLPTKVKGCTQVLYTYQSYFRDFFDNL